MRMKHLAAACGYAAMAATSVPALADTPPPGSGIDGVLADSNVALQFKPGTSSDPGGVTGTVTFEGAVISGSVGSTSFGSGASYASTSDIGPDVIFFKNGNASAGQFTFSRSVTNVDITFTNTTQTPVLPILVSQIVPAGFGIFVGPNGCAADPEACNPDDPNIGNFNSFGPVTAGGVPTIAGVPADVLASASFSFRIFADDFVAYSLTGELKLLFGGPGGDDNVLVASITQAADELNGFRLKSPLGSADFLGYEWDATDIDVSFGGQLQPGQQSTLRYETIVETYSRTACLGGGTSDCLVAYASFGDPVGRRTGGGSAGITASSALAFRSFAPTFAFNDPPPRTGLLFERFVFEIPSWDPTTGSLNLPLLGLAVPEPDSWAMMIAGFGLIGATLRQRRRLAA